MAIVMGKLCGGIFREGIKKTGEPFSFCKFVVQTAKGNCFHSMPEIVSVNKEQIPAVRAKLLSMPLGSDIMCEVSSEKYGENINHTFIDWFTFPKS